jgi:hypothetical protein
MSRSKEEPGPASQDGPFGSGWRRSAARRAKAGLARELRVGVRGKVSGIARPIGPLLAAPFTQRPCVFWCVEIATRIEAPARGLARLTGKKELVWEVNMRDASTERYWIIDEVGDHVIVDPKNAVVDIERTTVDVPRRIDDALGAFLLRHGFTPRLLGKDTPHVMFEAIVPPNGAASAWGIVTEFSDEVSLGYRDAKVVVRRIGSTRIDRAVILG